MLNLLFGNVSFVDIFNFCVFAVFTVFYAYQLFYIWITLTKKPPLHKAKTQHKFAVMISARNESTVIGDLLHSIQVQNYPSHLIDVYVIADNCTDDTADVARAAGANVIVRTNKKLCGKGYALDYGYKKIQHDHPNNGYEAYFVFDADNVLDVNYFREMNNTFDTGALASTSYRNSKNFGSNWVSAGYGIWFMREAKYVNQSRLTLHTSCAISGTGFYIAASVLKKAGGWKWHLLTEDIEFSTDSISSGRRIAYCPTAVIYDEQPTTFKASWNQRVRWSKGFYQVFGGYGLKLLKGMFANGKGKRFACYDMMMTIAPGMLLTIVAIIFNIIVCILAALGYMSFGIMIASAGSSILFCVATYMMYMFGLGILTTFTEWDNIHTTTAKKIRYMFTFPFFMMTYMPIAIVALFKKPEWKPIAHTVSVNVDDFAKAQKGVDSLL